MIRPNPRLTSSPADNIVVEGSGHTPPQTPLKPVPQPPGGSGRDDSIIFGGPVSVIDLHDPRSSPAPTVSPSSDADIAGLGRRGTASGMWGGGEPT